MPVPTCPEITIAPHHHPAVVALSAGGDSMALLHLAAERGVRHAVSVDHGLRDVAAELRLAAQACDALGVSHHVLRWDWDGHGNLQARARDARRDLIASWAHEQGMRAVLVGHTADDQAETVLLRLARGSGIDGLAAMDGQTHAHGIAWLRPMLHLGREELRNFLRARGVTWAEDPSNQDTRFDRVRARQMLENISDLGITTARLTQLADHAAAAQRVLDHVAQTYINTECRAHAGALSFPCAILNLSDDTARRVLSAAISWVGRSQYRPRWQGLKNAAQRVLNEGHAPLAGARLIRQGERLWVGRDLSAAPPAVPLGQDWDGWQIREPGHDMHAGCDVLRVAPLWRGLTTFCDWRDLEIPRAILEVSPAIWHQDELIAAPLLDFGPYEAVLERDFATQWKITSE